MKTHLLLAFVGLATGFVLPAFGQQKGTIDPKIEQQIRLLAANYDAAINKHDPAAVAALYAQDAVRTTAINGGTFYGRQAIENLMRNTISSVGRSSNYFTKIYRLTAAGNEVRSTGTGVLFLLERATASTSATATDTVHGPIVREGDTWKIRRDSASGGASPCHMNPVNAL